MFTKNPGEWLPPIYKNLLWRLELIVKDPPIAKLDADALWSESRGGGKIAEKQGNTSRRLHEALKDHCCFTEKQHPSGKIILEKKPFTDVIVCLHPDVYHDALITIGASFIHRLNSAMDNGMKPCLSGLRPFHWMSKLKAATVNASRAKT